MLHMCQTSFNLLSVNHTADATFADYKVCSVFNINRDKIFPVLEGNKGEVNGPHCFLVLLKSPIPGNRHSASDGIYCHIWKGHYTPTLSTERFLCNITTEMHTWVKGASWFAWQAELLSSYDKAVNCTNCQ